MVNRKPICLLPHCAYLSETTRMMEIRAALLARGAEVRVATHGGTWERLLAEAGIDYTLVGPRFTAARSAEFVRMGAGMGPPGQSMWSDEEILAYARAEAAFFRAHEVSAAVTGFTLTALLSTRLAGIPLVTEHAGSMVPPVFEAKQVEAFLDPPVPLLRHFPRAAQRFFANLGINRLHNHCAGFNRVAKTLGVEGVPSYAALLLGDLTLVTDTPDVLGISAEAMAAWRPRAPGYRPTTRLRYAGPLFAHLETPLPERVERFLEGDGPKVYVAVTSATEATVRAAVQGAGATGARVLVASTVHALSDLEGPEVMIEPVLPSHRVMPRVDLAITAGGQGSVQCAMAAGTPLVVIPLQPEQDFNGQIVERHHAGARISLRDVPGPALTALAKKILGDPRYREGARTVQRSYAAVDGAGAAADAILAWIDGGDAQGTVTARR
jgi:UDP:flavonoid glycosyltransferase YjiC (YdhE family)